MKCTSIRERSVEFQYIENPLVIYPFEIPYGYTVLQILKIGDNSRVELTGMPSKDRVKAKKKTMS